MVVHIPPCYVSPCKNGGVCSVISSDDYVCACLPGFSDKNCSTSVSTTRSPETTTNPSSSCFDYNSTICQNYANKSYCSLNIFIRSMPIKKYCALSCNACPSKSTVFFLYLRYLYILKYNKYN